MCIRDSDTDEARRIIEGDREVNATRFGIEADTLTLIATQQPMARDLRELAAILEIITELERIGDYAKGIARISLMTVSYTHLDVYKRQTPAPIPWRPRWVSLVIRVPRWP